MQRASAESIIALPKWAEPPEEWRERPIGSGMAEMAVGIVDAQGAKIRGLSIEIYAHTGRSVKRRKIVFGLFQYEVGVNERVYQLQLSTPGLFSHNDARVGRLYGAHAHIGDEAEPCPVEAAQWSFQQGLEYFAQQINLTLIAPLSDPFEFRLK